jgi:Flp pilus assembly protein TadB
MSGPSGSPQLLPALLAEQRRDAVNDAIDRLQATLEDARNMPSWGVGLVVVTSLLCAIILLHALALMATGPCLWAMWKRRNARVERLLQEEHEAEMEEVEEVAEVAEVEVEAAQFTARQKS